MLGTLKNEEACVCFSGLGLRLEDCELGLRLALEVVDSDLDLHCRLFVLIV